MINDYKSRLYSIHRTMKTRCNNPNYKDYDKYGGAGITVCDDWNLFSNFKEWAEANGYSDELSLDREDNLLGYYPGNCRWTTQIIQKRNRRMTKKNTSGYIGVNFSKSKNKYRAQVTIKKKTKSLGSFDNAMDAAIARDQYVINNKLIGFTLNGVL